MAEVQGFQLDAAPLQGHDWGHVASLGAVYRPGHWFSPARQIPVSVGPTGATYLTDFEEMRGAYIAVAPDPGHFEEFAAKNAKAVHECPARSADEMRSLRVPTLLIFGDRGTALASSKVTPFVWVAVLSAWTLAYGARQKRKGEQQAAASEIPGTSSADPQ